MSKANFKVEESIFVVMERVILPDTSLSSFISCQFPRLSLFPWINTALTFFVCLKKGQTHEHSSRVRKLCFQLCVESPLCSEFPQVPVASDCWGTGESGGESLVLYRSRCLLEAPWCPLCPQPRPQLSDPRSLTGASQASA